VRPRPVIDLPNYDEFLPDGEWGRLVDPVAAVERA